MAGVGEASAIVALIATAAQLSEAVIDIAGKYKNAEKQIESFGQEVALWGAILDQLWRLLSEEILEQDNWANGVISSIAYQGSELFSELETYRDALYSRPGSVKDLTVRGKMKWAFDAKQLVYLRGRVDRMQASMQLIINIEILSRLKHNSTAHGKVIDNQELCLQSSTCIQDLEKLEKEMLADSNNGTDMVLSRMSIQIVDTPEDAHSTREPILSMYGRLYYHERIFDPRKGTFADAAEDSSISRIIEDVIEETDMTNRLDSFTEGLSDPVEDLSESCQERDRPQVSPEAVKSGDGPDGWLSMAVGRSAHTHGCPECDKVELISDGRDTHLNKRNIYYLCMPLRPVGRTVDGQGCVFCGLRNPDRHHLDRHHESLCERVRPPNKTQKKSTMMDHLALHGVYDHTASELADQWYQSSNNQAFSCEYCETAFSTLKKQLNHTRDMFEGGEDMSEWDISTIIKRLLYQPKTKESWQNILASNESLPEDIFCWRSTEAEKLRRDLEMSDESGLDLACRALGSAIYSHNITWFHPHLTWSDPTYTPSSYPIWRSFVPPKPKVEISQIEVINPTNGETLRRSEAEGKAKYVAQAHAAGVIQTAEVESARTKQRPNKEAQKSMPVAGS